MQFGWINFFGAAIVVLMLVPNVIYAVKGGTGHASTSLIVNVLEQVGRYACMALMVLPIGVWKFGFASEAAMLVFFAGNAILLAVYYIVWPFYMRRAGRRKALALAIVPAVIFLLCGLCLRHWLLTAAAVVFGVFHIHITRCSGKN